MTRPLNTLTAAEIVRAVAAGQVRCEAVVASCLERITARDPQLRAWAALDREALASLRAASRPSLAMRTAPGPR